MESAGSAAKTGSAGREKRAAMVQLLRDRIRASSGMVFMDAQRLDSTETTELRKTITPTAATMKVVKNRLMKRACEAEQVSGCDPWLKHNTAVAFLGDDPVATLKALTAFVAGHDKLSLKGGMLDRRPMSAAELGALAALPGRRELLGMAAGTMKAPFARAARDFESVLVKLALLMKEAAKKAPQA